MRLAIHPSLLILATLLWLPAVHAEGPGSPIAANAISSVVLKQHLDQKRLFLRSSTAYIWDRSDKMTLLAREADKKMPIASLTKLMTAMVTLDAKLDMDEKITILRRDRDRLRGSRSRLAYGTKLTRRDMLLISLAASENRSAAALARTYPGGKKAFVRAMNAKAKSIGMFNTHFQDSTGLHSKNVSTGKELSLMVDAALKYEAIRDMTTTGKGYVTDLRSGWRVEFFNTNRLVRRKGWDIKLGKTGYIADSGHCLVLNTRINNRDLVIVLLNSWGKLSKFGDANRIKRWITRAENKVQRASLPSSLALN